MPDVNFVLALVREFPCIRCVAMTLAECGHIVLQGLTAAATGRKYSCLRMLMRVIARSDVKMVIEF